MAKFKNECVVLERAPKPQKGRGAAYVDEREKERNTSTILSLTDMEKKKNHKIQGKRWDKKSDLMQTVQLDFAWTCYFKKS